MLILFKKNLLFLLFLLLSLAACSLDPIVIEPDTIGDYYLFCTLAPTFKKHQLILGKSLPEVMPEMIEDARVILKSNDQLISMTHTGNGRYFDTSGELVVEPGEKYSLNVLRDGEQIIYGETLVPGPFSITSPCERDTIQLDLSRIPADTSSLPLVLWTPSARAKYYTVTVKMNSDDVWGSFHSTYRNQMYFPDIIPHFSYRETVKKEILVPATLYVFARDSSFVFLPYNLRNNSDYHFLDFTKEQDDRMEFYPFSFDTTRVKMKGALGAFSSISADSLFIYLKININWVPN
jgi:hypothetical protein